MFCVYKKKEEICENELNKKNHCCMQRYIQREECYVYT
jgi:hypothetical protein